MIEFVIKLASNVVSVRVQFDSTLQYCSEYLCDEQADLHVSVTDEDIARERSIFEKMDAAAGGTARERSDEILERTALQRKIVEAFFDRDILLFHGSVVAVDGMAYLFAAKSGTGKSTHTRLWRQWLGDRAVMVNDDKPFLQITPQGIVAHGSPWRGKHRLGANICAPLKAICILERAEENHIQAIPAKDAIAMLLRQSARPSHASDMPQYVRLLDQIAGQVSFYRLGCNMEPEAARIAYEAMSGASSQGVQ